MHFMSCFYGSHVVFDTVKKYGVNMCQNCYSLFTFPNMFFIEYKVSDAI